MRKEELEKLELDIAREKDPEVADRLKAVLEARKNERRERNLRLQTVGIGIAVVIRMVLKVLIITIIVTAVLSALGLLIAWFTGEFSR